MKGLAAEWAQHNIRVNAVCPGYGELNVFCHKIVTQWPYHNSGDRPDIEHGRVHSELPGIPSAAGPLREAS